MARKPAHTTPVPAKAHSAEPVIPFALPKKSAIAKERAAKLFDALSAQYPDARCELDAQSPLQLLLATILSAQCTDVAVNRATPALFQAFPVAADFARATPALIEPHIRSIGLFRAKAKAIHATCTVLCEKHGGEVPAEIDHLLELRGVARKTANVVLGNAFGIAAGVVVDTHVVRLSARLGLSRATTPVQIERDLMALFPRSQWCMLSHLLIFHGRRACKARGAQCENDAICREFCTQGRASRAARDTPETSRPKSKQPSQKVASTRRKSPKK